MTAGVLALCTVLIHTNPGLLQSQPCSYRLYKGPQSSIWLGASVRPRLHQWVNNASNKTNMGRTVGCTRGSPSRATTRSYIVAAGLEREGLGLFKTQNYPPDFLLLCLWDLIWSIQPSGFGGRHLIVSRGRDQQHWYKLTGCLLWIMMIHWSYTG